MKVQVTPIFQKTIQSNKRIIINEGSSRSSKTYSTIQVLINIALKETGEVFTIVRKTLPSLKATAMKDFFEILNKYEIYKEEFHNKSLNSYYLHGNEFEFISVDDYSKVKGRKRKYLFMNEANEDSYNDFVQLAMRTTGQIFMDYNPSHDESHWIEEKVKTRDDVDVFKSTYKENPFLNQETVNEIERLKDADPNLWRIYGLGIMGIASARIYSHFELCDVLPEEGETIYGLDFGFNHPTALVEVREYDNAYYIKELIYASGLTNSDLIERMKDMNLSRSKFMFCDSAEPNRIEEIKRAGFNARLSDKDVKKGIDTVKSKKIYITKDSVNLQKESRSYSYKTTTDGLILDEPVRLNDDALCAMRYAIHSYNTKLANRPNIRLL
jgi:phage terminase large subunit